LTASWALHRQNDGRRLIRRHARYRVVGALVNRCRRDPPPGFLIGVIAFA
jgi:hypothetical protein